MAHVILTVRPWSGSEHVSQNEAAALFVSDTTVNGIPIFALSPAEEKWRAEGGIGIFEQDELVTLTGGDGFMMLTIRHPVPSCYEALSQLDPDEWAEGSDAEEFVVIVTSLDIEVLEPAFA